MRAIYTGLELSTGLVIRGLIKTKECNSLMKDSWEFSETIRIVKMVTNQIKRREKPRKGALGFSLRRG